MSSNCFFSFGFFVCAANRRHSEAFVSYSSPLGIAVARNTSLYNDRRISQAFEIGSRSSGVSKILCPTGTLVRPICSTTHWPDMRQKTPGGYKNGSQRTGSGVSATFRSLLHSRSVLLIMICRTNRVGDRRQNWFPRTRRDGLR